MKARSLFFAASLWTAIPLAGQAFGAPAPVTAGEAREIAIEAYTYAYPMVLMEMTRRSTTNVETARGFHAPMNQFANLPGFPDASFTDVVRPNADTLYSSIFLDLKAEPIVISVPDSDGRYYLLPVLDMWTDVFTSPGSRTTGNGPQVFAFVGPTWHGELPDGVAMIRSPTHIAWMIGRTRTDGKADYDNVHKFQAGLKAVPLSAYGKGEYTPPKGKVEPSISKDAPVDQVAKMTATEFFALFARLTADNPPHANDNPILARLARVGLTPGKPFDLTAAPAEVRAAFDDAPTAALERIKAAFRTSGLSANGWRTNLTAIGTYGADYYHRAGVAYAGLGANSIEDAVYPSALADAKGKPFDSTARYMLHFEKAQIPPVRGFWSLTMYDDRQLFADNPINRYAIGDRDKLTFNGDGSLDIYIQRDSPGREKESNWLPAPKAGGFTMNLRLYWPRQPVLYGEWLPPGVTPAGESPALQGQPIENK